MYMYHVNPYNQSFFVFQVKFIPTRHTPPMNIGFQRISLPCHIHNQPISFHHMPRIYPSSPFITHTPSHFMHTHSFHTLTQQYNQTCILYPKQRFKQYPHILSPNSRLGQKPSLKREGFPRLSDRPSLRRDRDRGE